MIEFLYDKTAKISEYFILDRFVDVSNNTFQFEGALSGAFASWYYPLTDALHS